LSRDENPSSSKLPMAANYSLSALSTSVFGAENVVLKVATHSKPNQSMKPTAPLRGNLNLFAIDPARGLSLSR
jgi:hypothetical protein